jgi:hypothetical protein
MSYIAVGGAVISIAGSIIGASKAKKAEKAAKRKEAKLQKELNRLEAGRQNIINPYETSKDLSSMATDLSSIVSNPFANLGVATKAAEMQIEQSDIALANTLDTIRATGASAGGATALAQAALQSKEGVAASIESQEATNEKMKAEGEQQVQAIKLQQAQRIQDTQISEGQRIQGTDAAGAQFMFGARETREVQKLDRVSGQMAGQQKAAMQAKSDYMGAIAGGVSAVSGIAGQVGSSAMSKTSAPDPTAGNTGQFASGNYSIPKSWKD